MRRKHAEITDPNEIDRILGATAIGRIATNGADGYPYITPVNYVWFQGKVYFHCAPAGEKLNNLERDPKVCFEVDIPLSYIDTGFDPENRACRAHQLYHCVIIRGEARVVPDGPLKTAALNALLAAHEPDGQYDPVHEELPAYKACKVVEITPVSISAKSDLAQNKTPAERAALARYLTARNLPGDSDTLEAMGIDPDGV
jgi:nitroimidazol reductase NimA-like FMN-containing flavoprotein (pyridoxamine 5'-phosphate oxidase superfamily)